MDRGAWQATVHRVTKTCVWLSNLEYIHARVCMSLSLCIYIYIHLDTQLCPTEQLSMHTCMCVYIYIYIHLDSRVWLSNLHAYIHVCVCMCVYIQTYIYLVTQSWLSFYDSMDCVARQAPLSMGILQARILEQVAIPSSKGSSQPRDWI